MLKLEKSKNKKRLCCRLKVSTICINLQKMETLCQHSPLNKDTNIQTCARVHKITKKSSQNHKPVHGTISFRSNSIPFYCATFKVTSLKENVFIYYRIRANNYENGLYGQKHI